MVGEGLVTLRETAPIEGQKPGTSGLRKKTRTFMEGNYLANFVQATFDALASQGKEPGGTLVISGDGRYYNREAIQLIVRIAVANGVERIWIGQGGLLSTPAVSAVIRNREGGFKAFGGFILTASHNPGGIDEDFGIKYNCENGGPAPESVDLDTVGEVKVQGAGGCTVKVEVFSATADYVAVLSSCFDLPRLKAFVGRADVRIAFDALHGATGPYAREILVDLLGAREDSLLNCTPREDFGGKASRSHGHADPNLVNARELCELMGVDPRGAAMPQVAGAPAFGAAADGDADRNMILGPGFFVTPSDSLAVLVDHAADAIPFFAGGVKGAARSMPTSGALDRVCKARDIPCFETPTGWKFFGNLMDEARFTPFVCGEESFGTGSNHVREKDGLWAVLAWLSVLAHRNPRGDAPLVGIPQIVEGHWRKYGRNYYARYDYEGVETERANAVMAGMTARLSEGQAAWVRGQDLDGRVLERADVFEYKDPIDGSVSKNQGIRFLFADGSRIIFRLSGTGVSGATIRLYLEQYEPPQGDIARNALDVVKPLANLALALSDLPELTGRDSPSVIT